MSHPGDEMDELDTRQQIGGSHMKGWDEGDKDLGF
jgi:hypothetical protein